VQQFSTMPVVRYVAVPIAAGRDAKEGGAVNECICHGYGHEEVLKKNGAVVR